MPKQKRFLPYLREDRLPHIFCPGCGNGAIINAFLAAMEKAEMDFDNIAMVSGIGCSSRIPGYLNCDSLHTTHGRALSFATGLKTANKDLDVVVFTGDGDAASIGGNHLIHAARRNINLTVICINNKKLKGRCENRNSVITEFLNSDSDALVFIDGDSYPKNKDFIIKYEDLFEKYDVLLTPTSPTTAFKLGEKSSNPLEMYLADICTVPVNIAGLPGINVPCKLDSKGLPIGFQLIAKAFDEETLFRAAYTYEQNTNFRDNNPKLN